MFVHYCCLVAPARTIKTFCFYFFLQRFQHLYYSEFLKLVYEKKDAQ